MAAPVTREPFPEPGDARLPLGNVLASIAGVWLVYLVLVTARGALIGLGLEGDVVLRRLASALAAALLTFGLWLLLRLFDHRRLAVQIGAAVVAAIPAALLIAQANTMLFAPIQARYEAKIAQDRGINLRRDEAGNLIIEGPVPADAAGAESVAPTPGVARVVLPGEQNADRWLRLVESGLDRYFLLLAWAAIYFALLAGVRAREAERQGERFRSAAKAAELRSLRYQVNPHFLHNTLNSLSSLVMTGKAERAEQMIHALSRFYRHSLADAATGDVDLVDEIELQEQYLAIESVRFPRRLKVEVTLPAELEGLKVPGMILQPLVENSVRYAVSVTSRPVTIRIAAAAEGGRLVLTVADDGPGLPDGHGGGQGIGLGNVRDRLAARFGRAASLATGPAPGGGYATRLELPMVRHG